MRRWTFDPIFLGWLSFVSTFYVVGARRLWLQAGRWHGVRRWHAFAFAGGVAALLLALVSPLDPLSDLLFSAHMGQHEILMLVAAPLIVIGRPLLTALWALPEERRLRVAAFIKRPWVRGGWRFLTHPFVVLVVHAVVLWVWHIPALFEAALASEVVHGVQHFLFFLTAALFFWALIHGRYGRVGYGVSVLWVFATAIHSSILGALIGLGSRLWYPTYERRGHGHGIDALADQQLAGFLMWVPAGVLMLCIALALFAAWLGEAGRRAARATTRAPHDEVNA